MIEGLLEPIYLQFGAIGTVLAYFIYKDYKITPKIIETQKNIGLTLERVSIIIDERLPK